jgi:CubicO group peptidase (beta-lactamase class C family)
MHVDVSSATRPDLVDDLAQYVPEVMRITRTPGLSIALAFDGEVVSERGFGYADLQTEEPMTPRTVFRMASISKAYTVTAVLQLIEQGVLDLYAPVNAYLTDFRLRNPFGEREVTIYDLLTFRSGLTTDTIDAQLDGSEPLSRYLAVQLERDIRREYHGLNLAGKVVGRWSSKVGADHNYSSFGIAVLGYVVERMNHEGLSLQEYLHRHIFAPLGMSSSVLPSTLASQHVPEGILARLCTGYCRFGSSFVPSPLIDTGSYPATSMLSTPGDHLRWFLALLNHGELNSVRILQPESVKLMLTPHVRASHVAIDPVWWAGFVMMMSNVGDVSHQIVVGGAYPFGWWSDSIAYPAQGIALAVSGNRWDMTRWYNPPDVTPSGLIARYVSDRLRETPTRSTASAGSGDSVPGWAWKASFVMGFVLVERVNGLLGLSRPPRSAEMLGAADRAWSSSDEVCQWDLDGFLAGVAAMSELDPTPAAIEAFLSSDECPVSRAELDLVCLGFGRRGGLPVPMPYYAGRDATTVAQG